MPFSGKLIALNCRYTHSCLSLFYLRNELRCFLPQAELEIRQFTINDPYFSTLTHITDNQPQAIFFSVYIWNSSYVFRLAADINRILPDTMIILGGPQVAYMPDKQLPEYCSVVRGEIEGVPSSFYADLQKGELQKIYNSGCGHDFSLPYLNDDFANHLKNRHIYYESSRGCPYSCSYCLSAAEKNVKLQDIETVKDELGRILAHEPQTLRFVDRTFNISPERDLAIWQFLLKHAPKTCCHFEIAPDRFTEEMFNFLATVPTGRFQFEIGLQSTNPATLTAIRRTTDMKRALANIARLRKLDNIHLHVDLILGLPHETMATFRRSFNETFALFPHYIQMGLLKILPGAPLSAEPEHGLISCGAPPYEIMASRWLTHEELKQLYWFGECVEAFFNNRFFKTFFAWILAHNDDYFLFFWELLKKCQKTDFFNRATTQKLMSGLLLAYSKNQQAEKILKELLVFDWLRSGHKFLPEHLKTKNFNQEKNRLWQNMPRNFPPHYTYKTRNYFFKRSIFMRFSPQTLKAAGFGTDQQGVICFLTKKDEGLLGHSKILFISDIQTAS
jgi:radical SAM superfamily enzyme YgiQ (UPF0313 family)